MSKKTLYNIIDGTESVTKEEINEIKKFLISGMKKTINGVDNPNYRFMDNLSLKTLYKIKKKTLNMKRLFIENGRVRYTPVVDQTQEVREIREIILREMKG